jgi:diguanylate cyclase (GGDEF)-like protein
MAWLFVALTVIGVASFQADRWLAQEQSHQAEERFQLDARTAVGQVNRELGAMFDDAAMMSRTVGPVWPITPYEAINVVAGSQLFDRYPMLESVSFTSMDDTGIGLVATVPRSLEVLPLNGIQFGALSDIFPELTRTSPTWDAFPLSIVLRDLGELAELQSIADMLLGLGMEPDSVIARHPLVDGRGTLVGAVFIPVSTGLTQPLVNAAAREAGLSIRVSVQTEYDRVVAVVDSSKGPTTSDSQRYVYETESMSGGLTWQFDVSKPITDPPITLERYVVGAMATALTVASIVLTVLRIVASRRQLRLARELQRASDRLRRDELTGAESRLGLKANIAELTDGAPQRVALAYLDLNGFKAVNDQYGHAVGDRVLSAIAQRWRHQLPAGATLARLGGDEFAVLIDVAAVDPEEVIARLEASLDDPFELDGRHHHIGASLGVAEGFVRSDADLDELIESADRRMYAVKHRDRSPHASPLRATELPQSAPTTVTGADLPL